MRKTVRHRLKAHGCAYGAFLNSPFPFPCGEAIRRHGARGWLPLRYNHPSAKAWVAASASRTTRRYAPAFLLDPDSA